MKLNLRYTSDRDKRHIKQAVKLRNTGEAKRKGWDFIGNGVFKDSYKKGNIVVKFDRYGSPEYMLKEIKLYKNTPKKYRKYMARIFGGNENKIIQKFVKYDKGYEFSPKEKKRILSLSKEMKICDAYAGHNAVKTNDKKIIFYDFGGHGY